MTPESCLQIYKNLSKFCVSKISSIYNGYKCTKDDLEKTFDDLKDLFKDFDFKTLSKSQLKEIGFTEWDHTLVLSPVWVLVVAKNGTEFTSISGEKIIKEDSVELSLDTRYGSTAYGFKIDELRDNLIESILEEVK